MKQCLWRLLNMQEAILLYCVKKTIQLRGPLYVFHSINF